MAYVAPTTRSDGFVVPSATWNQDVVDNILAIRALGEVEPTIIAGIPDGTTAMTASTWTTQPLNTTVRDPDGIIQATDYANYEFDLADGDYLVELRASMYAYQSSDNCSSRLRDISNSTTLIGTDERQGIYATGMSNENMTVINYTIGEFTLANVGDTTIQIQSYQTSGQFPDKTGTPDAENLGLNGNWQCVIKLWKVG
jgi:hypothetical protein